jgi:hypothetical protein
MGLPIIGVLSQGTGVDVPARHPLWWLLCLFLVGPVLFTERSKYPIGN